MPNERDPWKPEHQSSVSFRLGTLESNVGGLKEDLAAKHKENRQSIHQIRNKQQEMQDEAWRRQNDLTRLLAPLEGLPGMLEKISDRCGGTEKEITEMKIQWAKLTGYVLGVGGASGAAAGAVFELVKWLAH